MNNIQTRYVPLNGTLDLVSPPIAIEPGNALIADNVQPLWGGGFGRIEGVEPIDGDKAPAEYLFYRLDTLEEVDNRYVGGVITVSGKPMGIIEVHDNDAGKKSLVVATTYIKPVENLSAVVTLSEGGTEEITLTGSSPYGIDMDAEKQAVYVAKAKEWAMSQVKAPLGDGALYGVVRLDNDDLIAFRDEGDKTRVSVAKENHVWQEGTKSYRLEVDSVVKPDKFLEGIEVTLGGNPVTLYAASFSADGQSGWLVVDSLVAASAGTDVLIDGVKMAAVKTAASEASLSGGSRWKFVYHNFYGGSASRYAYGTNGKDVVEVRPGGLVIPITPNDDRKILDLEVHKNHLFLAFEGGVYGHSIIGKPLSWEVLLGAEAFGVGDEITALQSLTGDYLMIGCKNTMWMLAGTNRTDWQQKRLSRVGVTANTLTATFVPIAHSENGFINVSQTQAYGDFVASELGANQLLGDLAYSKRMQPFFAFSHNKEHNQIRFYREGFSSHMIIQLLPDGGSRATAFTYPKPLTGVWEKDDETFLSFDDGRVYRQSDRIDSFFGSSIYWVLRLAYNHCKSPTIIKSWQSAELQLTTQNSIRLRMATTLDQGSPRHNETYYTEPLKGGTGGLWNQARWDEFFWSSPMYLEPTLRLYGHSKNISLMLSGNSNYEQSFEISGYSLSYINRRNFRV